MRHLSPFVVAIFLTAALTLRAGDPKTVGRILHSMVSTGREVLVWGGGSEGVFHRSGLRIDRSGELPHDDLRSKRRQPVDGDTPPSGREPR